MKYKTFLLTILCLYGFLETTDASWQRPPVPSKTSTFRNFEIGYFTKRRVLYQSAKRLCNLWHGNLVTIKNRRKQQHLEENMPINSLCPYFYYMGLYRDRGVWRWPDNSRFQNRYSKWRVQEADKEIDPCAKEPNGYKICAPWRTIPREQNATQISACRQLVGEWFDKDGKTSDWYYICERPVGVYTTPIPSSVTNISTTLETANTSERTRSGENGDDNKQNNTLMSSASTKIASNLSTTLSSNIVEYTLTTESSNVTKHNSSSNNYLLEETLSTDEQNLPNFVRNTDPVLIAKLNAYLEELVMVSKPSKERFLDIESIFKRAFSLSSWEENFSQTLGRLFLAQNESFERTIIFEGITIHLYKVSSDSDLSQIFKTSYKSNDSVIISFDEEGHNHFDVDLRDLAQVPRPFSVVSAEIEPALWRQKNLSYVKPARPFSSYSQTENNAGINSYFNILPSNASILSFSVFSSVGDGMGNVKKIDVSVSPRVSLKSDASACQIEQQSNWKVPGNDVSYSCRYFDTRSHEGKWSSEGCVTEHTSDGIVYCHCNHTTSFGVIVAVRAIYIPPAVNLIAIVLEVLTIVALALTVSLLLWLRKSMHSDRTVMQINLAVSLFFAHFFLVLGDEAVKLVDPTFCITCAVFSQFFVLTTAFWMLNEGIVLFFKTYKQALSFNLKKVFPYLALTAWGFPLIYVAICAGIGLGNDIYLDKTECTAQVERPQYHRCYVGIKHNMIYTIVVPIFLILATTSAIVVKTSISINRMSKEMKRMRPSGKRLQSSPSNVSNTTIASSVKPLASQSNVKVNKALSRHAAMALRAVVLLLPVLGITWVLAFFVNIPLVELPFLILHSVVSGLQGVFIFIIYCVQNSQFRRVFDRKWKEISTNHLKSEIYSQRSTRHISHGPHSLAVL